MNVGIPFTKPPVEEVIYEEDPPIKQKLLTFPSYPLFWTLSIRIRKRERDKKLLSFFFHLNQISAFSALNKL